jgi:hypothetical protein
MLIDGVQLVDGVGPVPHYGFASAATAVSDSAK